MTDICDLLQNKKPQFLKRYLKRKRSQATNWEKNAKHRANRELTSEYKELEKINKKKQIIQQKKMTEGPEQYFTIQVTIKDKNNFSDESHKNMVLQNLRSLIASSDGESTD